MYLFLEADCCSFVVWAFSDFAVNGDACSVADVGNTEEMIKDCTVVTSFAVVSNDDSVNVVGLLLKRYFQIRMLL